MTAPTMQDALARLTEFWGGRGCLTVQPMNTEVGAGTLNPATALRVLGPEPWNVAYVEPSVRPDDARYGLNPNRVQMHTQFQVILKPEPGNAQEVYLESLAALGIDTRAHDVRFVEDNWASPALGAWGLGWEVWLDGLEITQFTYFQQSGGVTLDPPAVEITYGMERILMALQGVTHFKDIAYAPGISYGEVFGQNEYEMSRYYLDDADIATHRELFDRYGDEAARLVEADLPIPAHVNVLKMSHAFNVLDARGAVSTSDRAAAFARMRTLANGVATGWIAKRAATAPTPAEPVAAAVPEAVAVPEGAGPRTAVLEIGTEEMPPAEARTALAQVEQRLRAVLGAARLEHGPVAVHATPRRITARIEAVAARESDREVTVRGPKVAAAFDADGNPTKAALGFARANGVDAADLVTVEAGGASHVACTRTETGRDALDVLAAAVAEIVTGLRSGKNMRWRDPKLAFTRPIRWLFAMWGDLVVPVAVSSLAAADGTRVHRSDAEPVVRVPDADAYLPTLAAAGIVLDEAERRAAILTQASAAAETAGGLIDFDAEAALADQVAFLIEQPTAVLGSFDPDYLELPEAILTGVMRKHQRYFPVHDREGRLMPHFVAVANGPIDTDTVREGNEAVLRARFEDAAFFYRADLKTPIADMRQRLERLSFAEGLGSIADRADRVRALAADVSERLALDADERAVLDQAARLVKFDLGSQMVTEMTSLAGTMARVYAIEAGHDEAVAQALFEAELPRFAGDLLPASPSGAVLAFADRLDFFVGLGGTVGLPTGSKDPFALRRAAIALLTIHRGRTGFKDLSLAAALREAAARQPVPVGDGRLDEMAAFLRDRLTQQLADEGRRPDFIEAVAPFADRPALAAERLAELEALADDERFRALAAAIGRVRRILPPDAAATDETDLLTTDTELALIDQACALPDTAPERTGLADWSAAAAGLPAAANAFFDDVLVNDPDPNTRAQRLALLTAIAQRAERQLDWSALRL
ncbi:glycine--tRNA ligase [Glycomyces paridis]|uniref:Multifunctional fusion protein n=1 Tax=Glycomyces paridis TaxID=2126555 RepID=A0A4S8PG62_9ACTN|nr:glycine--tRNA ligase [Glycomyces paridis]THV28352.1 glycine--tRNA ligase [Glycomyces paridis]